MTDLVQVVGGIVLDDQMRILAARRTRPESLAGLWEFPGGKVEPGESAPMALVRELHEELGIEVSVHAEMVPPDGGAWPIDDTMELRVWFCSLTGGQTTPGDSHDEVSWVEPDELVALLWAPADEPIAHRLAGR